MGRATNGIVKPKRPVAIWPAHPLELCRGVNDTWNSYQRANKGRTVTTAEWKSARSLLWSEHEQMLSSADVSSDEGFLDEQPHLYAPGIKRGCGEAAAPPPDLFCDTFEESSDYFAKRQKIPQSDWENGEYAYDCFDEWSDNFVIAPDEGFC